MDKLQAPTIVGYLGPSGTFSEEAAIRYFQDTPIHLRPFPTITKVIESVQSGVVTCGIAPIENTLEGTIRATVDGLAEQPDVQIQGEIRLAISQCLLGAEGAELTRIREIWSIPPALTQCGLLISQLGVRTEPHQSTAGAALAVKQSGRTDVAAIASAWVAKQMGLRVLADDIQDVAGNQTRFVVVTKDPDSPPQSNRIMLLVELSTSDHMFELPAILHALSTGGYRLTWLEIRPAKSRLGEYRCFIELEHFESSSACVTIQDAREVEFILQTYPIYHRVLGIYRVD